MTQTTGYLNRVQWRKKDGGKEERKEKIKREKAKDIKYGKINKTLKIYIWKKEKNKIKKRGVKIKKGENY